MDVAVAELAAKFQENSSEQSSNSSDHSDMSSSSSTSVGSNFCTAGEIFGESAHQTIVHHVFTQMSATQGIKKHGERAIAAIFKELKQLNDGAMPGKPAIAPIPFEDLAATNKKQALEAVNLIKEKRCGKLKGRTCANRSRQRKYMKDGEDFASPTASLESILTTLIIDTWEGRDVAVADVPGAYLHASFPEDKKVILKLQGVFIDIMCDVNPEYKKDVVYETGRKNKPVKYLCVRVLRALYGCIESALLWYDLYLTTLQGLGFKINPYNRCVANKVINASQCTVIFYVDNNKISHKDPQVVIDVLNAISEHFGDLTITRGSKYDFLGMNVEIKERHVHINMREQVQEAIHWENNQGGCKPTSPATVHLFHCDENAPSLTEEKSDQFHSIIQKLLYICKRARPDVESAVSYLCMRVSAPNIDDDNKLTRVLGFLGKTIEDERIIGALDLNTLCTLVDASYAVNPDMKSHTGGTMSLGHGTLHTKSSKQKLNMRTSTEAELVGVSDYLPYNIWMTKLTNNVIFQDNQSAMQMEVNGRNSCTGNSRHIDIRYFL